MILLVALLAVGPAHWITLLREGHVQEAALLLEAEQRREPRNAQVVNDLGFAYEKLGRRADAERLYRQAIQVSPARWTAYANLGSLLEDAPDRWERAEETIALLQQGLARVPPGAGRMNVALRLAGFERSVGRTAQARARLSALGELQHEQARRARELLDRIAAEEKARAQEDWPDALPSAAQAAALKAAEVQLATGDARAALAAAETLLAQLPAWRAAHWLRARSLDAMGRVDEEARALRILTQLAPSHARAWRRLGEILAQQGGLLEADRADEALRQALALEPSWSELWLLRARVALRQGRGADAQREVERYQRGGFPKSPEAERLLALARAQPASGGAQPQQSAAREPSQNAHALVQQAAAVGEAPEAARALLLQAVDDSPGYPEAAAALFALGGGVPDKTIAALRDDGAGLLELAAQLRRAGAAAGVVAPFVDRAVQLGTPEALYTRALSRLEAADNAGALADLIAYAASPQPQHLDEARTLRAQLLPVSRADPGALQARLRLAEDRPEAALSTLGSRCTATVPVQRLLGLGAVHEFSGELPEALECYRLASRESEPEALQRLARVAARAPDKRVLPELRKAASLSLPDAYWALAQLAQGSAALPDLERFLALAAPDDPFLPDARAARERVLRSTTEAAAERLRKELAASFLLIAALAAGALWLWYGHTLQRALRKAPRLFPPLARAVAEVRHDVIKHRASVLGMLAEPGASRADVARALLSPEPASQAVAARYEALRNSARAQGVELRRLSREPVFGPLVRDLSRAEALLQAEGHLAELALIDARIRELHAPRLAALLRLAPRTRLDATAVAGWIRDVEAEMRRGGARWTDPSILLEGMEVDFPVERSALSTIFANLLRNAQAAAQGGSVIVRLGEERDAAGRNLTVLLVGDSAQNTVSLEAIEERESGRGLALVRDLTREWQGHLVVRPEEAPWTKAVGACFPSAPAP